MALTFMSASITAGGTAHVKGSYSQLTASTPYASSRLYITFTSATNNNYFLIDIATGAASSETVVIANILILGDNTFVSGDFISFDIDIPISTRISARCQASNPSSQVGIVIHLEDRTIASISNPVTYGAVTISSRGTQLDPGGTINTKGAYTQITASTTARIDALAICVSGIDFGTITFTVWNLDIAIGASSSEVIIIPDIIYVSNPPGTSVRPRPCLIRLPASIPLGTRIAARCSSNVNTATQREISIILIGMQVPAGTSLLAAESVQFSVVKPE